MAIKKFGLILAAAALMLSACGKEFSLPVPAGAEIDGTPVPAGRIVARYVPDNPEAPAAAVAPNPEPGPSVKPGEPQVTPTLNLTLTVAPSGTVALSGTVAGPAPAGAGDRWVGPGRQMLNVVERIAAEDGGATYTWSAAMTIKFPNGKVVTRPAKASMELITIVVGNAQVSGEDNNVTVTYSDYNSPYGSYNWVENRPGLMTVAEALSLTSFKEQVMNSHKGNCGSGCKTVHVVVLNTAGVILYEGDL
jgi:hypothetical protein